MAAANQEGRRSDPNTILTSFCLIKNKLFIGIELKHCSQNDLENNIDLMTWQKINETNKWNFFFDDLQPCEKESESDQVHECLQEDYVLQFVTVSNLKHPVMLNFLEIK